MAKCKDINNYSKNIGQLSNGLLEVNLKVRFAYWFPVDRHGLRPRDDKTGKTECYEWTLKKLESICPKYFAF